MVLAFPYLRVVVMMWLSEPAEQTPTVAIPGAFTSAALMVGVLATLLLGVFPGAGARPRRECRRVHSMTAALLRPCGRCDAGAARRAG